MIREKGCTTIDAKIIERMQQLVVNRTDEGLNDQFGISYNTWRKLMAGQAIRASLADRLLERIRQLENSAVGARSSSP